MKIFSVKSLYCQAFKIYSSKRLLKNQKEAIPRLMSWNDFPKYICKSLSKISAKKPRDMKRTL